MNIEMGTVPISKPQKKTLSFGSCLLISFALHALLLALALHIDIQAPENLPVEIDLTNPLIGTGPVKLGAPKPQAASKRSLAPKPTPKISASKTQPRPRSWTLPNPQTKKISPFPPQHPPIPGGVKNGKGSSALTGGSLKGADYGSPQGHGNGGSSAGIIPPQLLNLNEVQKNLYRFYPEAERRAGKEGRVLIAIHIGINGTVAGVDILRAANLDFNAAAIKVAKLMKFSPARNAHGPVAVKIAQEMIFRLDH